MMKRSLSIVLLLALALTLCACGSSKPEATPAPVQEVSAQETPAESVPAEPVPEEEAAPDPAETLAEAEALFADGEYEQALALCEGVPGAAAILGKSRYLGLGCEVDHDRAVHDLEQAVEEGSVYSLYLLADAADKGNGTKQDKDEKDDKGRYIRRERFYGTAKRSFYVGEDVKQEDIKAKYTDGVLVLDVPKVQPKVEEEEAPKYIDILG